MTQPQIQRRFAAANEVIKQALQPYGYFKPEIYASLQRDAKQNWVGDYNITPGAVVIIHSVNATVRGPGKYNLQVVRFLQSFPIKPGEPFSTIKYNDVKERLFKLVRNQGYIKAHFDNKILIDVQHNRADIQFNLITDDRYYFGATRFINHIYAESFLRKILNYQYGEPYSNKKLFRLQQAMDGSRYFKQTIITPELNNIQRRHVPVAIDYSVAKAREYTAGIGYGTATGPRLTAGLVWNRVTDTGHYVEADLHLSSVISHLAGYYYIPGIRPLTDQWYMGGVIKRFLPKNGASTSETLTVGYVAKQKQTKLSLDLNLLRDDFKLVTQPSKISHELYPQFQATYVKADDLMSPKNAINLSFNVKGALRSLVSTNNFFQPDAHALWIVSPVSFARLVFRAEVGATAVSHLPSFPLSLRYYAGGMNSIRGFALYSIGPGKYLYTGSAEYQQKIWQELYAAVFYDAGNASNHFARQGLNRGAGVGLVYQTVVGPAKIYVAQALSKHTRPKSIEISIGPEIG